ncbi:hypothetical protein D3C81_1092500 [compost metagenome]
MMSQCITYTTLRIVAKVVHVFRILITWCVLKIIRTFVLLFGNRSLEKRCKAIFRIFQLTEQTSVTDVLIVIPS